RVRRVTPHPRPRLGHVRRLGQRRRLPRLLALVTGPFLPVEVVEVDDVPAHDATIPSAPMAEPRPAALPPAERTLGQPVAESIHFYGEHFRECLALGVPPAMIAVVFANVPRTWVLVLAPTLSGALISATYVWACAVVLDVRPPRQRLVAAWLLGW